MSASVSPSPDPNLGSLTRSGSRRFVVAAAVVLVLAVVAHWPALGVSEFVYDSLEIIPDNPLVNGEEPFSAIATTPYWPKNTGPEGLFRPLTTLSFRLEYTLGFGQRPTLYAATNLLLHGLVALALAGLIHRLTGRALAALIGGGLMAVHPIATSVVPNLVGRSDLLATLGCLLSLLAWEQLVRTGRHRWGIAAGLAWGLALLAKENAAFLPAVILLREAVGPRVRGEENFSSWLTLRGPTIAFTAILGVGWLIWRHQVLGGLSLEVSSPVANPLAIESYGLGARLLTGISLLGAYLGQALWPVHLSAGYFYNAQPVIDSWLNPTLLVAASGLVTLVAIAWLGRRRWPGLATGVSFFLLGLLPVSNIFIVIGTIRADRLLYLPLAGLALAVACLFARVRIRETGPNRSLYFTLAVLAGLTISGLLIARSWHRHPTWYTEGSFRAQMTRDTPNNGPAHYNYAAWLVTHHGLKYIDKAVAHADRGLEICRQFPGPPPPMAWVNAGAAHHRLSRAVDDPRLRQQQLKIARAIYREGAAKLDLRSDGPVPPHYSRRAKIIMLWHGLAAVESDLGHHLDAARAYRAEYRLKSTPEIAALMGRELVRAGRVEAGIAFLEESLKEQPDQTSWQKWLAAGYLAANRPDQALALLRPLLAGTDDPEEIREYRKIIEAAEAALSPALPSRP
ncbi:MAG: glycosyltransferase family 39 protein [Phycisphaeraceae bacterium]|nr:glycosyltransferase family 39 protein [Phycisphaeraceae bacterium]